VPPQLYGGTERVVCESLSLPPVIRRKPSASIRGHAQSRSRRSPALIQDLAHDEVFLIDRGRQVL
jgi:hypothetical protein